MKKKIMAIYIPVLILILMIATAIVIIEKRVKLPEYEWKDSTKLLASGPEALVGTTIGGIDYQFSKEGFKEKDATKKVYDVSRLFEYVEQIYGTPSNAFSVYFGLEATDEIGPKGYVYLEDSISFDNLFYLVKNAYYSHISDAEIYGLVYAYGIENKILDGISDTKNEELAKYFNCNSEDFFLLDMSVPMLEAYYVTEEQSNIARMAVQSFSMWMLEKYSLNRYEEIILSENENRNEIIEDYKNKWLSDIGVESSYVEFAKLPFKSTYSNSKSYELETEDAIWIFSNEDIEELTYRKMVAFLQEIEPLRKMDFAEARDYLEGYLPENLEKVKIITEFCRNNGRCEYDHKSQEIHLSNGWDFGVYCLLHEYCHHLTIGEGKLMADGGYIVEWFSEGISTMELQNRVKKYAIEHLVESDESLISNYWDAEKGEARDFKEYAHKIALFAYEEDNMYIKINGNRFFDYLQYTYPDYACLFEYVVDTYGFEQVVELVNNNSDFEKTFGFTEEELYLAMISNLQSSIN